MTGPVVIAVDGPAASGKGTLARRLAAHYGLRHLDTGLLYRAVGLIGRGLESIYSRVLQDMKERDARDRARTVAPLIPAKDALVIDSSRLDADAVFARAVGYVNRVLPDLASGSSRA